MRDFACQYIVNTLCSYLEDYYKYSIYNYYLYNLWCVLQQIYNSSNYPPIHHGRSKMYTYAIYVFITQEFITSQLNSTVDYVILIPSSSIHIITLCNMSHTLFPKPIYYLPYLFVISLSYEAIVNPSVVAMCLHRPSHTHIHQHTHTRAHTHTQHY